MPHGLTHTCHTRQRLTTEQTNHHTPTAHGSPIKQYSRKCAAPDARTATTTTTCHATHLNGVNVGGDDDEASLLVLYQVRDVVQAVLDVAGSLAVVSGAAGSLGLGRGLQTLNLLRLRLRTVLLQQLEHRDSCRGRQTTHGDVTPTARQQQLRHDSTAISNGASTLRALLPSAAASTQDDVTGHNIVQDTPRTDCAGQAGVPHVTGPAVAVGVTTDEQTARRHRTSAPLHATLPHSTVDATPPTTPSSD